MQKNKFLAALLSAAMVITSAAIPVFADEDVPETAPVDETVVETADEAPAEAAETADDGIELMAASDPVPETRSDGIWLKVSTYEQLEKAIRLDNASDYGIKPGSDGITRINIELQNNITKDIHGDPLRIGGSNAYVTLKSPDGHEPFILKRDQNAIYPFIWFDRDNGFYNADNTTLELENIIIEGQGKNATADTWSPLIFLTKKSHLILGNGATLRNKNEGPASLAKPGTAIQAGGDSRTNDFTGTVTLKEGSRIENCNNATSGGAIYLTGNNAEGSGLFIEGGTITGCTATSLGGAIHSVNVPVTITKGTFSNNTAPDGAVLCAYNTNVVIGKQGGSDDDIQITGNNPASVSATAGIIKVKGSSVLNLYSGTISGNNCGNGAAVYIDSGASANFFGGKIVDNTSENAAVTNNSSAGEITFGGNIRIMNNNTSGGAAANYMYQYQQRMSFSNDTPFTKDAVIHVKVDTPPTASRNIALTYECEDKYGDKLVYDGAPDNGYAIKYNNRRGYYQVVVTHSVSVGKNGAEPEVVPGEIAYNANDYSYKIPGYKPGMECKVTSVTVGGKELDPQYYRGENGIITVDGMDSRNSTLINGDLVINYTMPYAIDINSTIGGTVTASPSAAMSGDEITLTVTPDDEYELKSLTATYGEDETNLITGEISSTGGEYTFDMPNDNVTVNAVFMKKDSHTIVDALIADAPTYPTDRPDLEKVAAEITGWTAKLEDTSDLDAIGDAIDANEGLYEQAQEKFPEAEHVYLHVVTDLEFELESYDTNAQTLTVDISAVRHILASTDAVLTEDQKEHPSTAENVVDLVGGREITVKKDITLSIPMPSAFTAEQIEIDHTHNDNAYKYVADNVNNVVTFTAHGLSTFIFRPYKAPAPVEGDLTDLIVSVGGNDTKFSNAKVTYETEVANGVASVDIKPIFGSGVKVAINGEPATSDTAMTIGLKPGENVITVTAGEHTYTITITREVLEHMSVYFKQTSNNRLYEIILKAGNGKKADDEEAEQLDGIINRLNSADLTFALEAADGVAYRIAPAEYIDLIDAGKGRYEFNFKKGDDDENNTGNEIVIGTVEFLGYGEVTSFKVDGKVDTNAVHPTTGSDNIVTEFVPGGKIENNQGDLNIDATKFTNELDYYGTITNIDLDVETQEVTINVMFPNKLYDGVANEYIEDMTVTVEGGAAFKSTIPLGDYGEKTEELTPDNWPTSAEGVTSITKKDFDYNDPTADPAADANANGYQIKMNVPVPAGTGARYTFTFSGEGYRTFSHDVVVDGKKTITVWNNAMDDKTLIVEDGDEKKDNFDVTFLAGDIVEDNKINLYDLSAVAAYFGKSKADGVDMSGYVQYDLNRDGMIDSKDIAMVLVSWDR